MTTDDEREDARRQWPAFGGLGDEWMSESRAPDVLAFPRTADGSVPKLPASDPPTITEAITEAMERIWNDRSHLPTVTMSVRGARRYRVTTRLNDYIRSRHYTRLGLARHRYRQLRRRERHRTAFSRRRALWTLFVAEYRDRRLPTAEYHYVREGYQAEHPSNTRVLSARGTVAGVYFATEIEWYPPTLALHRTGIRRGWRRWVKLYRYDHDSDAWPNWVLRTHRLSVQWLSYRTRRRR